MYVLFASLQCFYRDVEDEKLWVDEKMPQATSTELGNSLQEVQALQKKNQVPYGSWHFL